MGRGFLNSKRTWNISDTDKENLEIDTIEQLANQRDLTSKKLELKKKLMLEYIDRLKEMTLVDILTNWKTFLIAS